MTIGGGKQRQIRNGGGTKKMNSRAGFVSSQNGTEILPCLEDPTGKRSTSIIYRFGPDTAGKGNASAHSEHQGRTTKQGFFWMVILTRTTPEKPLSVPLPLPSFRARNRLHRNPFPLPRPPWAGSSPPPPILSLDLFLPTLRRAAWGGCTAVERVAGVFVHRG